MIDVREKIEEIVLSVRSSGSVDSFTNNGNGTYTIGTSDTGNLQAGFKVVLQYSDTSLNRDVTLSTTSDTAFIFSGTGITEPDTWQMALYFDVGHRIELNKKYANKANAINKMVREYPLFWLYSDFEKPPSEFEGVDFDTTLQGALVDFSEKELYEEDRVEQHFTPVLYPYMDLIDAAFNTWPYKAYFATPYGTDKDIDFLVVDRPFFGSADKNKNVLPNVTDAIEWQTNLHWKEEKTECLGYY